MYRIARAFADVFVASYEEPPEAILLDIDDTEDKVYGSQQLSLFNAYFNGYCYQPLHIYEGQTGKLITTVCVLAGEAARVKRSSPSSNG